MSCCAITQTDMTAYQASIRPRTLQSQLEVSRYEQRIAEDRRAFTPNMTMSLRQQVEALTNRKELRLQEPEFIGKGPKHSRAVCFHFPGDGRIGGGKY